MMRGKRSESGMGRQMVVVYIKLERSVEVEEGKVLLSDVAYVECQDAKIKNYVNNLCIYRFKADSQKRTVINVLRIIQLLENNLQKEFKVNGEHDQIIVQSVGEKDVFVQWVKEKEQRRPAKWGKIALVSLVTLCGSAFTIMAYHNDIEIHKIFEGTVRLVLPQNLELGLMVLEIAYSIGLATGIIVFFNHIGKWKINNDPTPIEVALRKYEMDVDMTLIENADREGAEVEPR